MARTCTSLPLNSGNFLGAEPPQSAVRVLVICIHNHSRCVHGIRYPAYSIADTRASADNIRRTSKRAHAHTHNKPKLPYICELHARRWNTRNSRIPHLIIIQFIRARVLQRSLAAAASSSSKAKTQTFPFLRHAARCTPLRDMTSAEC